MRTNSKVCQRLGLAQPSSINLNKVLPRLLLDL